MALPTTGRISLGDVRKELNKTGPISLGSSEVRNLAGKTSGSIKMSDLYGKSSYIWEGQLTIVYDPSDNNAAWGYNSYYNNGKLVPNTFNSYEIKQLFLSEIYIGVTEPFPLVLTFEETTNFEWITMLINNKVYKLTDIAPNSQMPKTMYYAENDSELLDYFKANIGKTIPVYILEAKLK